MQEHQLQELRREKWRLNGRPVRTLEEAREFIDSVGFCLLYPQRPPLLVPTFVGAYVGSDEHLPTPQMAFADPRAHEAKELLVRLLRQKAAYETNVFPENNFIVSAAVFPYFYSLAGDQNPRHAPTPRGPSGYSPLAVDAFRIIQKNGPISKQHLREALGGDLSEAALDRGLDELWTKLRITRVDYKPEEGVFWDVLLRWSPDMVWQGIAVSVPEAVTALVSKYLDCVLAAQQEDLEQFFSKLIGRAKVREAVHALQAGRELRFVHVGSRMMLQPWSLHFAPAQSGAHLPSSPARFEPLPPERGKPLVQRRPRRSAAVKPIPDKQDSEKQ
jgi:23S rRNA pseudouridine2605 synthase